MLNKNYTFELENTEQCLSLLKDMTSKNKKKSISGFNRFNCLMSDYLKLHIEQYCDDRTFGKLSLIIISKQ